jgi:hypothetical protein
LPDVSLGTVLVVASASIFGPLSGWLATQRQRHVGLWLVFGILLGPIAPALILGAPPGRCAACRWPVAGWGGTCTACGADVRTGAPAPTLPDRLTSSSAESFAEAPGQPEEPGKRARGRTAIEAASSFATRESGRSGSGAWPAIPPLRIVPGLDEPASPLEPAWSSRVPATRLGHRPPDAGPAAPTSSASQGGRTQLAILGSGVYVGGNRPIQAGSRYLLARVVDELQVLGPIHLDPGAVADRVPIESIEAFVIEGRLLIVGRDPETELSMAFVSVSQESGVDIVAALGGPASAASAQ